NNPTEQNLMNYWWQETLEELRLQLTRSAYETCLVRAKACSFRDGVLTVQAPGDLAREKLEHRLAPLIRRILIAVSDAQVQQVRFVSDGQRGAGQAAPLPQQCEG
ncbi:MAG: DnaA N-terminal domain-containing protein, partial [Halothiobacillaceae bacterium]